MKSKINLIVLLVALFSLATFGCEDSGSITGTKDGGGSDGDSDGDGDGDGDGDSDGDSDSDGDGDVDTSASECSSAEDAGGFTFKEIPSWMDGATAAYSFIHDDLCDFGVRGIQNNAVPALNAHHIHAGLGPFVEACDDKDSWGPDGMWDQVLQFQKDGHEIINHSYTHPSITTSNSAKEVTEAKQIMDDHMDNPITFYIFPYDYFTSSTISAVESAGHIGARAGDRDDNDGFDDPPINKATPEKDMEIEFDVWPRTYSKYALFYAKDILTVHAWNAIEAGGWAVREFHSVIKDDTPVEGNGFGPVKLSDYKGHLDFLVDAWNKNKIWTAPPSQVIKYRHARTACKASVSSDTITFDTSDADCTKFATPISVIVTTGNDVNSVQGMQDGKAVYTRKIAANTFSVTADPTAGDITLSGCADKGRVVESGDITAKPSPADSVCDIVTIAGTGSPGNMDNLERDFEKFQELPNVCQADGRDGSWSWYPQNVEVEMLKEGDNTVLRYAATGLGAWTGATLAFLGGNGAGSCYDASAYKGLKFKIKGTVTGGDLAGKVIVSMVTAETQTRKYGGDLDGTGGHFNKVIDVTGSWQTVSIAWGDFGKPTWGDTVSLSALATKKLQAIDWGISDKATAFEIFLDDIELY